jgi:hypothetical protein
MKNFEIVAQELRSLEQSSWSNLRVRRIIKAAPLVVMFLLLNTRSARAGCSFTPSAGAKDGASNSLRAAIIAANGSGQDCTIHLQAGTYNLSVANTNGQENEAKQGDLDITGRGHTVTIVGQGPAVSIVNANAIDRVFQVLGGANANFERMTIEGGMAQDDGSFRAQPGSTESDGGGILVQDGGHVTLSNVWVEGNQAIGGNGVYGSCTTSSVVVVPTPGQPAAGAGLFLSAGSIDLAGSKISANAATGGTGGFSEFSLCGGAQDGGSARGGGLYVVSGRTELLSSAIAGNRATGGKGGKGREGSTFTVAGANGGLAQGAGLFIGSGSLELGEANVSGNVATGGPAGGTAATDLNGSGGSAQGGGIFISNATARLIRSTVSANVAEGASNSHFTSVRASQLGSGNGGGLYVGTGNLTLTSTTVFANTAKGGSAFSCQSYPHCTGGGGAAGGGLYINGASVSLAGVTLASNSALEGLAGGGTNGTSSGGGIAKLAGSLVSNVALIGNNEQDSGIANHGDDVSGAISASHSLLSQTAGATITDDGGNLFNTDPQLDPAGLKFNGGPTQTVALQDGSPAIDKGDNAVCAAPVPNGLAKVDQRGFPRFRTGDELCDIGAFEFTNLLIHPTTEFYGTEAVGAQSPVRKVPLTNEQTTTVALATALGGTDPGDFVVGGSCGTSLAPDTTCVISIAFKPTATGTRKALLTVSDSPDRTSPYKITLIGEGK